jgi:thiamine pyrophosphate-dependent acetolactate synthase large subunit-like protein
MLAKLLYHFLREAGQVLRIGRSFTRHGMTASIPAGKTPIHATNDERDLDKSCAAERPLLGDARLVLRQFIEALTNQGGRPGGKERAPSSRVCIHTEPERFAALLGPRPRARIFIEAATVEWVARCLERLGHEVTQRRGPITKATTRAPGGS